MRDDPVFILTCGRSGSTLLQKLMNTHDELLIWGEHAGFLNHLIGAWQAVNLCEWISDDQPSGDWLLESPRPLNVDKWTAWDLPFTKQAFLEAVREMVERLFAAPCSPETRWGFKEIRYHSIQSLELLLALFPACRLMFLMREPVHICVSFAAAQINASGARKSRHARIVRKIAKRLVRPFFEFAADCLPGLQDRSLLVSYEGLVEQGVPNMHRIADFLELRMPFDEQRLAAIMDRDIVSQRKISSAKLLKELRMLAQAELKAETRLYRKLTNHFTAA